MSKFLALAAVILLCAPGVALAGDVAGRVYDSRGLPVAGVAVNVDVAGIEVLTDVAGGYAITGLSAGEHGLSVTLADGAVQRVFVEVAETGASRRNIFLLSAASLQGVQTFARSAATGASALAEAADLPTAAASGASVVAWRWRDTDA